MFSRASTSVIPRRISLYVRINIQKLILNQIKNSLHLILGAWDLGCYLKLLLTLLHGALVRLKLDYYNCAMVVCIFSLLYS